MIKKLTIAFSITICFANPLLAQQWSYAKVKFEGQYVAEVYTMKVETGQLTNDSVLSSVKSFDDRNYVVEEVEKEGLRERNVYDSEGRILIRTAYYNDRKPMAARKTENEYVNGLQSSTTYYDWKNKAWLKGDKTLNTYKFNKKGQVIQETLVNEAGKKYFDAYTTYDPKYKLVKPYYDKFGNLHLPGGKEIAVVMDADTMHFNCYEHDATGKVLQFIYKYKDRSTNAAYSYEYDAAGRLIAYNYTSGTRFDSRNEFEYNSDGRLIVERELVPGANDELVLVEELHYHYLLKLNKEK